MKCLYESLTPIEDALFRVATFVQMIGVLILTFGLPVSFSAAADGQGPNNMLMVIGYVIMRVPPSTADWHLIPLAAAIIVGAIAGSEAHINPNNPSVVLALVTVIGLVALSAVIEVVGHEMVGSKHTFRAVKAKAA